MTPSIDWVLLGGAAVPLGMWGLSLYGGATVASALLLVFQVGLNLPHYFQTYGLTYFDPGQRRRAGLRLWGALALSLLVPFTAIGLGARALQLTLAAIALWGLYHITQQTRGLAGLYLRRAGESPASQRDFRQALLWLLFSGSAALVALRVVHFGPLLNGAPQAAARPFAAAFALAAAIALVRVGAGFTRARRLAVLLVLLHLLVFGVAVSVADLNLVLVLATSWHALQYLGLSLVANRRRSDALVLPRLARHEVVAFFALALGFSLVAAALGAALPRPWGQAIYLPLLLLHYLNDAWLWRPDRNPEAKVWLAPLLSPRAP